MQDRKDRFRSVNPMLGVQPRFGPFPAEHLIPWTAIALTAYVLCQGLLGLGWLWTGLFTAWGVTTWWILTGDKPWRFLSRFMPTPYWVRGHCRYQSPLHCSESQRNTHETKVRRKKRSQRAAKGEALSRRR
ncbi:MAG: hypothetical protein SFW36_03065 [Leptolyngbyaceae cyanobacterium bins.59]|nr:hypothetical protein [Leptolyngbyaceae cyanobacterium bins.59]